MKPDSLLRSLSHRNFRLYFFGQSISLIGTWMQQIAMSWLVFQLTGSSFQLGLVLFCGQIPALFLAPVAGVLVDRWNKRRMLLITQTLAMLQAFTLALLDSTGTVAVWQILPLSFFLGMVTAFDMTGRQSFLVEMVENRGDLSNAIALNSTIMNGARLLGPSLAGLVLAETSASVCFIINGISYLAVLAALLSMRLTPRAQPATGKSLREGLNEGFAYAFGFAPIRYILLMLCLGSMVGSSYNVLLPEFSQVNLHGNARTLGLLSASTGFGALCGALFLAARKSAVGLGKWIAVGAALMGGGLIAFSQTARLSTAMPALAVLSFGMMVQTASSNTLLQTIADEDKRGRVMSFFTMAFLGMAPLGSLLTGTLARNYGIVTACMVNGSACMLGAALFAARIPGMRELVRPIYVRLNLLPPLSVGVEQASELKLMVK